MISYIFLNLSKTIHFHISDETDRKIAIVRDRQQYVHTEVVTRQSDDSYYVNKEVLARWSDDGWYYHGRVIKEEQYRCFVQDATGYFEAINKDDLIVERDHRFDTIQVIVFSSNQNYV